MISDGEVFNTEVVRIVKTVKFGFGVIIIRDSIWHANSLRDSDNPVYRKTESDWKVKMTSDEEVFNTEVMHIIKTVNFGFGVIIIKDSIWPTSSLRDSDNPVYCKTGSDWKVKMTSKNIQDGLI